MAVAGLKNLCTPASIYLGISLIAIFIMGIQNYISGSANVYCLGSYSCVVSSTVLVFMIKLIYVLFWTWILNLICRAGAPGLSWLLVLFPFILLFVLLAYIMIQ
jgi:hypothetical protein